jgi:DNA-binding IclR family transcriptional regulator
MLMSTPDRDVMTNLANRFAAPAAARVEDTMMAKAISGSLKPALARKATTPVSNGVGTGTVQRVIALLSQIASTRDQIGVAELSGRLDLPMPTTHRLLHLLREEGMVDWNASSKRYSIGPELFRISALVSAGADLPRIAQREIDQVAELTGEATLFGVYLPNAAGMSFIARAEGRHALQYRIELNTVMSLVWGASGRAILAYLPDDVVAAALARTEANASGAPRPDAEKLDQDLARIRRNGYAVSEGEKLQGARGVAAPVFNQSGITGSICVTSPSERIPIDSVTELAEIVREAAGRISRSLGAS